MELIKFYLDGGKRLLKIQVTRRCKFSRAVHTYNVHDFMTPPLYSTNKSLDYNGNGGKQCNVYFHLDITLLGNSSIRYLDD